MLHITHQLEIRPIHSIYVSENLTLQTSFVKLS